MKFAQWANIKGTEKFISGPEIELDFVPVPGIWIDGLKIKEVCIFTTGNISNWIEYKPISQKKAAEITANNGCWLIDG